MIPRDRKRHSQIVICEHIVVIDERDEVATGLLYAAKSSVREAQAFFSDNPPLWVPLEVTGFAQVFLRSIIHDNQFPFISAERLPSEGIKGSGKIVCAGIPGANND